jgi:hypothetical protein
MSLTPLEEEVLTTLEDELRADDPALAAALNTGPGSTGHSNPRPRGWVRDELATEWRAFPTAIRLFFCSLPVGLVLSVIGGVVGLPWMMVLAMLVLLSATGCTVSQARARRKAS